MVQWSRPIIGAPAVIDALAARLFPAAFDGAIKTEQARVEGHQLGLTDDNTNRIIARHVKTASETACRVDWDACRNEMIRHACTPEPVYDTLAHWLFHRFAWRYYQTVDVTWLDLDEADRMYWQHEADATRRAVERGGFK